MPPTPATVRIRGMNEQTNLPPVVLLTDFGVKDAYVGMMKGVLQQLCPGVTMIDLTHAIPPQDVRQAAFVLWTAFRYFPKDTVFLVVVDPGVGSERKPVAIRADGYHFVGPDNGVFGDVLATLDEWDAVTIDESQALAEGLTATFHGRDLFAPTAARLAAGSSLSDLGTPLETLVEQEPSRFIITPTTVEGEITYIDHFGNVISSIGTCQWQEDGQLRLEPRLRPDLEPLSLDPEKVKVTVSRYHFLRIARTYTEAEAGKATALINSAGQLEIAINQGNAHRKLDLTIGNRITIHLD